MLDVKTVRTARDDADRMVETRPGSENSLVLQEVDSSRLGMCIIVGTARA